VTRPSLWAVLAVGACASSLGLAGCGSGESGSGAGGSGGGAGGASSGAGGSSGGSTGGSSGGNTGTGGSGTGGIVGTGGGATGGVTGTGGLTGSGGGSTGGVTGSGGTSTGGMTGSGGKGTGGTGAGGSAGHAGAGGAAGSATGTGGAGGAFQPAAHPALPQVLTLGGAVLSAPRVLPILFPNDSGATDVKAFLQELATSTTWTAQTSEYGVGPLTVLPAVTVTGTTATTFSDTALRSMIQSNTSGANPAWGPLDAKTIYFFLLPQGTVESDPTGTCCSEFYGYHSDARIGATFVPYAVGCTCPGTTRVTSLQDRTATIDHELVEASTDPYPNSDPAFTQEDDDDIVWTLVTGGEVADMCEFDDDANVVPTGAQYMIQRTWSNQAAAAGQNPCVPSATGAPYLNTFPILARITDDALATGFSTMGLNIPIGQKKTIPLTLSSAGPTSGTWTVKVYDYDEIIVGTSAGLTLSQDKTSGRNGDTIQLTITPLRGDPSLGGGEAFLILSTYGKPGDADYQTEVTMGLVTN
jgi:hypothetical protein